MEAILKILLCKLSRVQCQNSCFIISNFTCETTINRFRLGNVFAASVVTSLSIICCSFLSLSSSTFSSNFSAFAGRNLYRMFQPDMIFCLLRGPAPKKRPMISGSKIESADFYLPSRDYRILFKNDFVLCQFRFKPKISSRKLFLSDSSKIRPKISPRKKRFRNHYRNAN